MVLNVAFGRDPSNPEHLLPHRVGVLDRIRQIGFERFPAEHLFVYYKQDLESWKRAIYRMQDMIDAATSDIAARSPRLGRILRFRSLSGI